jgi:hypothetical protein
MDAPSLYLQMTAPTLTEALAALDAELARLRGEVARLTEARAVLVGLMPPVIVTRSRDQKGRTRSPDGEVRKDRVLAFLHEHPGSIPKDIVAALDHDPKVTSTIQSLWHACLITRRRARDVKGLTYRYSLREQDPHGQWAPGGTAERQRRDFLAALAIQANAAPVGA